MSTIATNALTKLNEEKQAEVVDKAVARIILIQKQQDKRKQYVECIKEHQKAVSDLTEDVLTALGVLGREPSATPSQNEVTILKAIKERNDAKQKCVEAKANEHLKDIDGYNKLVKECDDEIAELRKQIAALADETVTAAQVLG